MISITIAICALAFAAYIYLSHNKIAERKAELKAQQEAKMADEERQKHLDDAARMKRRANTADIVRKKLSRENAAMKEELDALRKFKAASLAINASRAFAVAGAKESN